MKHPRIPAVITSLALMALLAGCGDSSSPTQPNMSFDTTPPPAPTALTMTLDGPTGTYQLNWDASAAPDVATYQVYQYSPDPSRESAYVLLGEATAAEFHPATPDKPTTCVFRVQAVDASGNHSAFSAALTVPMMSVRPLGYGGGGGASPGADKDYKRKMTDE